MWKWIRKWLLKVPGIQDRILRFELNRELKRLRDKYSPQIDAALKAKDQKKAAALDYDYYQESRLATDPFEEWQSDRLVRKARRHDILVPPIPRDDKEDDKNWQRTGTTYEWVLTVSAARQLRREVRQQSRAAYDEWRKWVTLGLALAGFILGLASVWVKTKQPDPCPRNYYRNDGGACVFASQAPAPEYLGPKDAAKD